MRLANFLQDLLERGEVTVAGRMVPFADEDLRESLSVLEKYHAADAQEMPGKAPEFFPDAAIWAAQYLYHAAQLAMLRDLGEEVVKEKLHAFSGPLTPQAIYSVDLSFRYLPDLLHLTKGLAPGDILVATLLQAARQWPFSSVGIELSGDLNLDIILAHPSLKYAYVDRIIQERDTTRMHHPGITELIQQAMGQYTSVLWPDFNIS